MTIFEVFQAIYQGVKKAVLATFQILKLLFSVLMAFFTFIEPVAIKLLEILASVVIEYLKAHGESPSVRAVSIDVLQKAKAKLGPDHPTIQEVSKFHA